MKEKRTTIDAGIQDTSRPSERPPKSNWKTKMIQKGLATLQHISPTKTAEVVWYYFTKPGSVRFKESHLELLEQAFIPLGIPMINKWNSILKCQLF